MANKRVLLVDDELFFWKVMNKKLESWGYEPSWASNGRDALDTINKDGCDIVILDYIMADTDGVAILRQIRENNSRIPVIMFTAHPEEKAIKDAQRLAVSAFIPKSSEYGDMHLALKTTLEMISKELEKKG
jgi:DNA-binding NtrC family response regulator